MKMTSFESLFESAVNDGTAPGIVVIAKDKDGKVDISKAFSSKNGTPYTLDTVMELSSMTKFPTSIAALQLVERGLVTLDEDLSNLLPSFSSQGIFISVADDGTPTVRKRQNPITLRHLITHSSGAGYNFLHEGLGKIRAAQRKAGPSVTVDESFNLPLLFEPGEGWAYSTGLDRVGQVVEKLSGMSLDEYMRKNIWEPLGAESSVFLPDQHPSINARRVSMAFRKDPEGPAVEKPEIPTVTTGLKVPFGGHGLFSTMPDYFKLVYSLLMDDQKLLKKETAALIFQPQLTPASKEELNKFMETPEMKITFPSPPNDYDFGLGGLLIVGEAHPYWRKGALMWGGAASLNWFVDRSAGICGVFGAQVLPSDSRMRKLIDTFQADVYRMAGKLT
ncbi:beta-lactamase family protein [Annulohypoxylon maeteangense]|uniref:beta-lactamase family protein n=1 Tax=Annulohypoxylon maeteangense TaxID=1927788 RepID=UPI0020081197|nr:beta-lactamase family protein [Annulohypoxylon maeteangense]KAI0888556.1 beta-lactamase family protein [Annulohypoxylon maeteangense]